MRVRWLLPLLAVAALSVLPTPALAASAWEVEGEGEPVNLREGPGTDTRVVGSVPDGAWVTIVCTARGTTETGPWGESDVWDRLDSGDWISDAFVRTNTFEPVEAPCDDGPPPPSDGPMEGVDTWNGTPAIDWASARAGGLSFAMVLATEADTSYNDDAGQYPAPQVGSGQFGAQFHGAKDAGLFAGAYHFGRPDHDTNGDGVADTRDARAQAAHFIGFLQQRGAGNDDRTLPPMLDLEANYPDDLYNHTDFCWGQSPQGTIAWTSAFLEEVLALTGERALLYTEGSYWRECVGSTAAFADHPLWIAAPGETQLPDAILDWDRWTFWQWSHTAQDTPGYPAGTPALRDRFNGDAAALAALAAG